MAIIECATGTRALLCDIGSLRSPDERACGSDIGVFFDEPFDGHDRFFGIAKDTASQSILSG